MYHVYAVKIERRAIGPRSSARRWIGVRIEMTARAAQGGELGLSKAHLTTPRRSKVRAVSACGMEEQTGVRGLRQPRGSKLKVALWPP